jgi:hypothetical protein
MKSVEIKLRDKSLMLQKSSKINFLLSCGKYITALLEEEVYLNKNNMKDFVGRAECVTYRSFSTPALA